MRKTNTNLKAKNLSPVLRAAVTAIHPWLKKDAFVCFEQTRGYNKLSEVYCVNQGYHIYLLLTPTCTTFGCTQSNPIFLSGLGLNYC